MPESLTTGIPTTVYQNVAYALPARVVRLIVIPPTGLELAYAFAGPWVAAPTLTESFETCASFFRVTAGNAVATVKT